MDDYINKGIPFMDHQLVWKIMKQLAKALNFMHELSICHGDIKIDNIQYDTETDNLKILDFGNAKLTHG